GKNDIFDTQGVAGDVQRVDAAEVDPRPAVGGIPIARPGGQFRRASVQEMIIREAEESFVLGVGDGDGGRWIEPFQCGGGRGHAETEGAGSALDWTKSN